MSISRFYRFLLWIFLLGISTFSVYATDVAITETFSDKSVYTGASNYYSGIWTSTNGITWRYDNLLVGTMTNSKITYSGVKFLANTKLKRTSGFLWTSKIRGLKQIKFLAIQSGSPTFTIQYSQDGFLWKDTTANVKTSFSSLSITLPEPGDYYVRFKFYSGKDNASFFLSTISFLTSAPTDTTGQRMDIVDWRKEGITLNMNGCDPTQGVSASLNNEASRTIPEGTTYSYLNQPDRTYSISTSSLTSGQDLYLQTQYADANGTQYESAHYYRIPYIFTHDTTILTASFLPDDDIVVRSGTTTISAFTQVRNVYVYPGAKLCVNNGSILCCSNLYVRTTPFAAGVVSDTIKAQNAYYTRIVANNTRYFQFALPFASTTQSITSTAGDIFTLDRHWRLNVYDTELRAERGIDPNNWVRYDGSTISPNVGYAMLSASPYYREYLFPISYTKTTPTSVDISAPSGDIGEQHNGWNYICSPLSSVYSSTYDDPAAAIKITELSDDGNYYLQHIPASIAPAKPFYYQASTAGNLVFSDALSFVLTVSTASSQVASVASCPTDWIELVLSDSLQRTDVANLFVHPTRFDNSYQVGYDLQKFISTSSHPQIYSVLPYGNLSFAAVCDTTVQQGIILAVSTPTSGMYTISLRSNDYIADMEHVYLTDSVRNITVDLLDQSYSFSVEQGGEVQSDAEQSVDSTRFVVRCIRYLDSSTPTEVSSVASSDSFPILCKKIFYKGQLYILRDGAYFSILGTHLQLAAPSH